MDHEVERGGKPKRRRGGGCMTEEVSMGRMGRAGGARLGQCIISPDMRTETDICDALDEFMCICIPNVQVESRKGRDSIDSLLQ